jgi:signal peptidase
VTEFVAETVTEPGAAPQRRRDLREPGAAPQRRRDRRGAGRSREKGLWHYIGVALSSAMLLLVLGVAALAVVVPAIAGGTALTVLTQSMEPKLPPGTLIVIRPAPIADIRIGDVLTYQVKSDEPAVISHRVVSRTIDSKGKTTFVTKGDNNDLPDAGVVQQVQIRGTLWYSIPLLGYVNNVVGGQGRVWIVPIVAVALFAYAAYMIAGTVAASRRKKRAASSGETSRASSRGRH